MICGSCKWKPTMNPEAFFMEDDLESVGTIITESFDDLLDLVLMYQVVVFPEDGFGR